MHLLRRSQNLLSKLKKCTSLIIIAKFNVDKYIKAFYVRQKFIPVVYWVVLAINLSKITKTWSVSSVWNCKPIFVYLLGNSLFIN